MTQVPIQPAQNQPQAAAPAGGQLNTLGSLAGVGTVPAAPVPAAPTPAAPVTPANNEHGFPDNTPVAEMTSEQ